MSVAFVDITVANRLEIIIMSAAKNEIRTRFQVSMSPATLKRLDDYCARLGVSRSAYISMVISQNLDQIETMNAAIADKVGDFLKAQSATRL